MRILLAIVVPPLGMLSVGRPLAALLCLVLMLTVVGWPVAAVWAVMVVSGAFADARTDRVVREQRRAREAAERAERAAARRG